MSSAPRRERNRPEGGTQNTGTEEASDPRVLPHVKESGGTYGVSGREELDQEASEDGDGPLSAEEVRAHWSHFLDALRPRDLSLEALMRSCEPVGVEDDVVVLSFIHKFHRNKVEEDEKRDIVEDVISDLFGRPLRVRCVVRKQQGASSTSQRTDPADRGGQDSPEQDLSADPLVRMAVDELGAEVVEKKA